MTSTVYLGLGANLGDRRETFESALARIGAIDGVRRIARVSSVHETPALLPDRAPVEWNRPYLNAVLAIEVAAEYAPLALLDALQAIERELGRERIAVWAPRTLDIDILHWEKEGSGEGIRMEGARLTLPHARLFEREFVLGPLAEIAPDLVLDGVSVSERARRHSKYRPRLMGILNITPDSFSDGGVHTRAEAIAHALDAWDDANVPILDLGAESTRPGSVAVTPDEEWRRLEPVFALLADRYRSRRFRPEVSIDTRHPAVAARALPHGASIVNDVSGFTDVEGFSAVLRDYPQARYVLMHSLTVPADGARVLPTDDDVVETLRIWFEEKLASLERAGIARERVILDPGIGFGKTATQSLALLQGIGAFHAFGLPVLVGHSRKSFLGSPGTRAGDRDPETLGVSFALRDRGVEILRVHDPVLHHRAFLAWGGAR